MNLSTDNNLFREIRPDQNSGLFDIHSYMKERDEDQNKPHIVSIVLNNVIGDSRVIKTAQAAVNKGYRATIVGYSKTSSASVTAEGDVNIFLMLNPRHALMRAGLWASKAENRDMGLFVQRTAEDMLKIVRDLKPDLLHTHDMYALKVGAYISQKLANGGIIVPWVHDIHEYAAGVTLIPDNYRRLATDFETRYLKQPDKLITVSSLLRDTLVDEHHLTMPPTVVYNTPYCAQWSDEEPDIRSTIGLPKTKTLIAYVGGIATKERGVGVIIEALPLIPDAHVCFVTNHNNEVTKDLLNRASTLGIEDRVHFHPYVDSDKVSTFVRTADLGAHPMIHFPNGEVAMPNKLFEYLHGRVPVVVSDVKEMKRFVERYGVGKPFEAGDPNSFATAVKYVINHRYELIENITSDFLSRFSWNYQEQKLARIYGDLLDSYDLSGNPPDPKNPRVFHGVTGAAGQPWSISTALKRRGLRSDVVRVFKNSHNLSYSADRAFDLEDRSEAAGVFSRLMPIYDVFHFYSRPFFLEIPDHGWPTFQDILILKAARKVTIMHFQGSEVRLASRFKEISPFHWMDDLPDLQKRFPEATQRRVIDILSGICDRVLVLDPEMASYVPDATIVPRSIDLDNWPYIGPSNRDRPVVVHAPTNRVIKGTDHVLKAVEELQSEGLKFEFRLIEDVPSTFAREQMQEADIVVDQLRMGWYAVVAVEAMALGKAAVSYVADRFMHDMTQGGPAPMAVADPTSIKEVLRALIVNPDVREEYGRRGRDYCERVHDSRLIAARMASIYEDALRNPKPFTPSVAPKLICSQMQLIQQERTNFKLRITSLEKEARTLRQAANRTGVLETEVRTLRQAAERPGAAEPAAKTLGSRKKLLDPPFSAIPARIIRRITRNPVQ